MVKDDGHIFISYAREDRDRVAVLAGLLETKGWKVWWDRDHLPAGQQFDIIIDQAIQNAACVMVCWSNASVISGWVIAEATEGLEQNKFLPLFLEKVRPPLRFRPYNAIDFSAWNKRTSHLSYLRLKSELQQWNISSNRKSVDEGNIEAEVIKSSKEDNPEQTIEDKLKPEVRKLIAELELPETEPERRLEIGDQLNDMEGGDPRFGVGLDENGLPEIDWVSIPAGTFIYGEGKAQKELELPAFEIARYPVTNAQFQAFIDDGSYENERWWRWWNGLKKPYRVTSHWPQGNRPRTNANWFESSAFTRWLSYRLGQTITLPHEYQWERTARGEKGLVYPWGNECLSGYANLNEHEKRVDDGLHYLGQTTAVGIYPHAASPENVLDLSGNVWEWCLNDFEKSDEEIEVPGSPVLRGGSWYNSPESAGAVFRGWIDSPGLHNLFTGFRLLRSPPS